MARVRRRVAAMRRTGPAHSWNLEIAGIAALGAALLLALSLMLPSRSGAAGAALAGSLHVLFGSAAWLVPVVVALLGAIVFLEINVPRLIATLGTAALAYFLIIDTAYGRGGGFIGNLLMLGLHRLVGPVGTAILLVF